MDPKFIFVLLATLWSGEPHESDKVGGYRVASYDVEEQCNEAARMANEQVSLQNDMPTFQCLKLLRALPVSGVGW